MIRPMAEPQPQINERPNRWLEAFNPRVPLYRDDYNEYVVFELAVIFFIARPQMKPVERVMWAALWAGTTAVMALAFYYLVAEPTL